MYQLRRGVGEKTRRPVARGVNMAALQAQAGDFDRLQGQGLPDALARLQTALGVMDKARVPPHIGARLQEVIESLEVEIEARRS